jgi:hypothetical protein
MSDPQTGPDLARGIRSAAKEKNYPANCSPVCTHSTAGPPRVLYLAKRVLSAPLPSAFWARPTFLELGT